MSPSPTSPGRPGSPTPIFQSGSTPTAGAGTYTDAGQAGFAHGGMAGTGATGQSMPPREPPPPRFMRGAGGPSRRWLGRLGWFAFFIALLAMWSMYNNYRSYFQSNPGIEERYYSLSQTASDKVAIIDVEGLITHQDGFAKWQVDRALADESVKAIVLRVDSPGGTVTGSNYLYHQLTQLAKKRDIKLVVSMGGVCASGGYYISMAVGDTPDSIYAEPTTWTGSIGVVIPHYNLSGMLEKYNVSDDSIVSNPLKLTGSLTYKGTPEIADKQRKILQELVDDSFHDFKEIVKSGRPKYRTDAAALDTIATGQVFTANQAKQNGLVDQIGYLEDAIDQAIKINKLNREDVRVVKYRKPKGLLDDVLGGALGKSQGGGLSMNGLLDLATPRAYFIWTSLPALAAAGGQ